LCRRAGFRSFTGPRAGALHTGGLPVAVGRQTAKAQSRGRVFSATNFDQFSFACTGELFPPVEQVTNLFHQNHPPK